jgi:Transposase
MDHVGIDLGKRESQIAILTEDGELINRRIRTERLRLAEMFGRRPQARILLEASTESEWVARCLEDLGHEVIVADPNYAPMYARRTRRVKTDRRDAHALVPRVGPAPIGPPIGPRPTAASSARGWPSARPSCAPAPRGSLASNRSCDVRGVASAPERPRPFSRGWRNWRSRPRS